MRTLGIDPRSDDRATRKPKVKKAKKEKKAEEVVESR